MTRTQLRPLLPCLPAHVDAFLSEPTAAVCDFVSDWSGRVLVLGAGGKMGLHLCSMLRNAISSEEVPVEIIAVSRFTTLHDRAAFSRAGIATIACDLFDSIQVARLPDAERIYFLAGLKFGTSATPDLLQQMNILVPRLVAERFKSSRIVAFSTGCVYPFVSTASPGADESVPPDPVGEYAVSCLGRENEFASASRIHGTPVTLIRLNYAVEVRYGVLIDVATKVRDDQEIDLTMGHVNLIWQRDAVDQIIRSLAFASSPVCLLNIAGADVLHVRRIAADFGRLLGRTPRFRGHEAPTAWLNNAATSHRLLGAPPTSLESMEQWVAAWLLTDSPTWGKPTGFEKRDGQF